ncbi:MAG TPA: MFS transporter [Oligoflexia bacterium]|nr:MFS transporter [Oligoflexia bacterium]HMP27358.1 MFS transporter [Oligoflexia bacterium]
MFKPAKSLFSNEVSLRLAILVAALGYFVDVYDIVLFSVVRTESLKALGLSGEALISQGVFLLNLQMIGMLIGGLIWGIVGDKIGRVQVLFGSILLYSAANIFNAFVGNVLEYSVCRLLAGIGLAGELGAGVTLVSELMPKEKRGLATAFIAAVGVCGAIGAALVGDLFPWRISYIVGGVMGLMLLVARVTVNESNIFEDLKNNDRRGTARGSLKVLFFPLKRFLKYLAIIIAGLPIWYVVGILVTFAPEISVALGYKKSAQASMAVLVCYFGLMFGDLASGVFSQILRSRKKAIVFFLLMASFFIALFFAAGGDGSVYRFYGLLCPIGFFIGYWAVLITTAAEQFGTNIRATVATSVPNFIRGGVVPMTILFEYGRGYLGIVNSAIFVGVLVILSALVAINFLKESFGIDLNYVED